MVDATQPLIDRLVADALPVRPLQKPQGLAMAGVAFIVTAMAVLFLIGARHPASGEFASVPFVFANGLLLILGVSCVVAVVKMAMPQVGASHDAPKWAMAMAGVLPVAGVLAATSAGVDGLLHVEGAHCMVVGLAGSVLVGAGLFAWLRRGAPALPRLAGFYLGVAAGALGSVANGLTCSDETIAHLGIWHVAPVVIAGLVGRFVIARWLRW